MSRDLTLGGAIAAGLCAVQLALVPVLDRQAADVTRAGQPFAITGLRDGVVVRQQFDVGYGGLAGITLDASASPAGQPRYVEALVAGPEDGNRVTRRATVAIPPGATRCCTIAFDRIPSSGRRFRLELRVRGFRGEGLTLQAVAVRHTGGLWINQRVQPANLVMHPDGAVEHIPGAMRVSRAWFGTALFAINLLAAVSACRLRRF